VNAANEFAETMSKEISLSKKLFGQQPTQVTSAEKKSCFKTKSNELLLKPEH